MNDIQTRYGPAYLVFVDLHIWRDDRAERNLASDCRILVPEHVYTTINHLELADPFPHKLPEDRTYCFDYSPSVEPGAVRGAIHHGYLAGYFAAALAARMVHPRGTIMLAGMDLDDPEEHGRYRQHGKFREGRAAFCALRTALEPHVRFLVLGRSKLLDLGFEAG